LAAFIVEVQADRAERQIEVHDDGVDVEFFGDAPADIVGDAGGTGTAASADEGDNPTDRLGGGIKIKAGDDFDQLQRGQGRDQIFRSTTAHQFAIELH